MDHVQAMELVVVHGTAAGRMGACGVTANLGMSTAWLQNIKACTCYRSQNVVLTLKLDNHIL